MVNKQFFFDNDFLFQKFYKLITEEKIWRCIPTVFKLTTTFNLNFVNSKNNTKG